MLATRPLRYLSLFSGMEAASAAIERLELGWEPLGFAEIDPAACAVLAHRWPEVPNLGDITKVDWTPFIGKVDVVLGGSPCQSFSVAGKRLGLNDRRGNLALEYLNVVSILKPTWFLYENVPGLLSSADGRDFGAFLGTVADIGYSAAWRLLDARHSGVAQRRRRLFVVGHAGDWEAPSRVLALAEGVVGDQIPRGAPGQGAAADARGSLGQHDRDGEWLTRWKRPARRSAGFAVQEYSADFRNGTLSSELSPTLQAAGMGVDRGMSLNSLGGAVQESAAFAFKASHFTRGKDGAPKDHVSPLTADADKGDQENLVVQHVRDKDSSTFRQVQVGRYVGDDCASTVMARDYKSASDLIATPTAWHTNAAGVTTSQGDRTACLRSGSSYNTHLVTQQDRPHWVVRRLTPTECLRLQGFDDDWLDGVILRGKPLSDSQKYKLAGNSWAVPCAAWVIERIAAMDQAIRSGWQPVGDGEN